MAKEYQAEAAKLDSSKSDEVASHRAAPKGPLLLALAQ